MQFFRAHVARLVTDMRNHSAFLLLAFAADATCVAGAAAEEFSRSHTSAWHLSVVDGGRPRGVSVVRNDAALLPVSSTKLEPISEADRASWSLQLGMVRPPHVFKTYFGPAAGIPIAGDFNGDGFDELGMFLDGRWFVDLNGNNQWDKDDLWASFGSPGDLPVVGDWNQDGKDDFGIVTRAGAATFRASTKDPGFAHPLNNRDFVDLTGDLEGVAGNPIKNLGIVRNQLEPALLRSAHGGEQKAAVRHVFEFGDAGTVPVVGDWSGSGVKSIGTFHEGCWKLDLDGDGRWTTADALVHLGQPGDKPVVGDFNRDGRDDLGVYRRGTWHIDTTGDRRLGPDDLILHLGDADDTPVVGDWDGDGRAQIGVVHRNANGS